MPDTSLDILAGELGAIAGRIERETNARVAAAIAELRAVDDSVPDDVAELVAKAMVLLHESPAQTRPAIVLNVNTAAPQKTKTITTRRDESGNLIAEVIEQ